MNSAGQNRVSVILTLLPPLVRLGLRLGGLRLFSALQREPDVPKHVVDAARAGDPNAFRTIVGHYDDRLRGLAYRLLENRDLMDDCLQEAYVKAFRALPKFKGRSSLGTWLYRIVYNTCIDELRRRRHNVSLDDAVEVAGMSGPSTIDRAIAESDLASAMAGIAPDQRAAVMLVDAYGWSYKDAAQVLKVPPGTVASRVNRARRALKTALEVST